MKLPNPDRAVIAESKPRKYLLSTTHPMGRFKAAIFNELGYSENNWRALRAELAKVAGQDASEKEVNEYGSKYEIRSVVHGPSGKSLRLVSAWIVLKNEEFPRSITAYPGDRV